MENAHQGLTCIRALERVKKDRLLSFSETLSKLCNYYCFENMKKKYFHNERYGNISTKSDGAQVGPVSISYRYTKPDILKLSLSLRKETRHGTDSLS